MIDKYIDVLKEKWDKILKDMQKPGVSEKMQKAFDATPEELAEAANRAAKKKDV